MAGIGLGTALSLAAACSTTPPDDDGGNTTQGTPKGGGAGATSMAGRGAGGTPATGGAGFLQIPAARLVVHTVVGGEQDGGIGRGIGELAEQGVESRKVIARFGGFGWPHMHRVVRGVDVDDANIRLMADGPGSGLE